MLKDLTGTERSKKMRKYFVFCFLLFFVASVSVLCAAETAKTTQGMVSGETVEVGNKLCPVSGQPVSGRDFAVYQGKRYGLCCPMCEKSFLSDPQKYISRMDQLERSAVKGG